MGKINKNKKPNTLGCPCGYEFLISQAVFYRLLVCPKCGRNWWYERDLKNVQTAELLGKFKSKKEREKVTYESARKIIEE